MNKTILLSFGLAGAISMPAADIAWISFHAGANDAPNANATTAGFTKAPDVGYTDVLRNAGHNVTRVLTSGAPDTALLNTFDLVIISRSVPSGDYELDAETAAWNGITAPTMILGGYILRSSRLGYTTGTTIPDTTTPVKLTVNEPGHQIFAGVPLDGNNVMVDDYAGIVSVSGVAQRGISVNNNPLAGNGTLLASVPAIGGTGLIIGEWQAGATMGTAPADTLGGKRLVLLTGSREGGTSPVSGAAFPSDSAGVYDLTPAGERIFLNAVDYMAVPEPSSFTLLAIGAGMFMLRRRK